MPLYGQSSGSPRRFIRSLVNAGAKIGRPKGLASIRSPQLPVSHSGCGVGSFHSRMLFLDSIPTLKRVVGPVMKFCFARSSRLANNVLR
jgi:hypothetical protein